MCKNFISFEGGEGAGKTTQAKLLQKSFNKIKVDSILTREPGGTPNSEKIRSLIVNKNNYDFLPETELLLVYAARYEHLKRTILPNLKKKIVICDRFYYSTLCYQIIANKISHKKLKILHNTFCDNIMPGTTIFININARKGVSRSLKEKNNETKFENKEIEFHNKINNEFLKLSKKKSNNLKIDGDKDIKDIHHNIIDFLNKKKITKINIPYSI